MTVHTRSSRVVSCVVFLTAIAASVWGPPTLAQRAPSGARTAGGDTTTFDFVNADVQSVLTAVAEAGNLQVGFGTLPPKKYSLHIRRPVDHDGYVALLRSIADANDLTMTEKGGMITVAAPPAASPADATNTRKPRGRVSQKLYVYQLRHANATKLAAVLQAIFANGNVSSGGSASGRRGSQRGGGGPTVSNDNNGNMTMSFGGIGGGGGGGGNSPFVFSNSNGQPLSLGDVMSRFVGGNSDDNADDEEPQKEEKPTIVPEESTNSLLVRATPDQWTIIKEAIGAVDIRPLQVLIEVVIAEVQHTDNLNVGATGTASNQRTFNGRTLGSGVLRGDTTSSSAANFIASLTRYGAVDVNVALAALQSRGNVHVLSRPLVLAENNVQSQLVVGSQRPFVQTSQTFQTGANNNVVQYRDVGTKLTIMPTINPDGYVNLQVQQEVSSATNEIQFGAPVIDNRQATATLFVRDGQTAVVGGLADSQDQDTRSGIPVLKDIPVLGALFRTTTKSKAQTEFFLFLTPHIVQSDSDMNRIRDEIRQRSSLLHTVQTGPIVQSTIGAPSALPTVPAPAPNSGTAVPPSPPKAPGDSTPPMPPAGLPFQILRPGNPTPSRP